MILVEGYSAYVYYAKAAGYHRPQQKSLIPLGSVQTHIPKGLWVSLEISEQLKCTRKQDTINYIFAWLLLLAIHQLKRASTAKYLMAFSQWIILRANELSDVSSRLAKMRQKRFQMSLLMGLRLCPRPPHQEKSFQILPELGVCVVLSRSLINLFLAGFQFVIAIDIRRPKWWRRCHTYWAAIAVIVQT